MGGVHDFLPTKIPDIQIDFGVSILVSNWLSTCQRYIEIPRVLISFVSKSSKINRLTNEDLPTAPCPIINTLASFIGFLERLKVVGKNELRFLFLIFQEGGPLKDLLQAIFLVNSTSCMIS